MPLHPAGHDGHENTADTVLLQPPRNKTLKEGKQPRRASKGEPVSRKPVRGGRTGGPGLCGSMRRESADAADEPAAVRSRGDARQGAPFRNGPGEPRTAARAAWIGPERTRLPCPPPCPGPAVAAPRLRKAARDANGQRAAIGGGPCGGTPGPVPDHGADRMPAHGPPVGNTARPSGGGEKNRMNRSLVARFFSADGAHCQAGPKANQPPFWGG